LYFDVPLDTNKRKIWYEIAIAKAKVNKKSVRPILYQGGQFRCQDHFDLPVDVHNFIKFKLMGHVRETRSGTIFVSSRTCQDTDGAATSLATREANNLRESFDALNLYNC